MKFDFLNGFLKKKSKHQTSRKSVWWEPGTVRTGRQADRQTGMTQVIVTFCNSENAPKTLFLV
jgi:hypothetical protein